MSEGSTTRHHQALAGGTSTSELPNRPNLNKTRGASTFQLPNCADHKQAKKLKYHRLKPGGVRCAVAAVASFKVEVPPAKAWWCLLDRLTLTPSTGKIGRDVFS